MNGQRLEQDLALILPRFYYQLYLSHVALPVMSFWSLYPMSQLWCPDSYLYRILFVESCSLIKSLGILWFKWRLPESRNPDTWFLYFLVINLLDNMFVPMRTCIQTTWEMKLFFESNKWKKMICCMTLSCYFGGSVYTCLFQQWMLYAEVANSLFRMRAHKWAASKAQSCVENETKHWKSACQIKAICFTSGVSWA